jgi:hypothetical protein
MVSMSIEKMKRLRNATPEIAEDSTPDRLFLSKNDKTGISINTSIALTCRPTPGCAIYCYGLGGRIAMPASLQRQAENAALFGIDTCEWGQLADEAMDIAHVVSRQQDFLRMFGVGDLQLGSVYFINQLAAYAKAVKPKFRIWVSTRKFDMAAKLVESPNLHVMLSFDATTLARHRAAGLKLLAQRRPQFFAAWVRCSEDETVPKWVNVVFEEHAIGRGRAKRPPERRACPATIHESYPESTELESACSNCQYCFDAKRRSTGSPLIQLKGKK